MKNFFKQLGKAVCYVALFGGVQYIVLFVMVVFATIKMTAQMMAEGIQPSETEIMEKVMEAIVAGTNGRLIVAAVLTLLLAWVFFAIRKKKLLKEANVIPFSANRILPLFILAIASVFVVKCTFFLLPIPEEMMMEYEQSVMSLMGGSTPVILISTVLAAPVVEEIIFRGLVLSRLSRVMPTVLAAILSSIAFGIFHGQLLWICYAAILGLMMSFIAVKCESVLASILYHMVFNLLGGLPFADYLIEKSQGTAVIIEVIAIAVCAAMIIWILKLSKQEKEEKFQEAANQEKDNFTIGAKS